MPVLLMNVIWLLPLIPTAVSFDPVALPRMNELASAWSVISAEAWPPRGSASPRTRPGLRNVEGAHSGCLDFAVVASRAPSRAAGDLALPPSPGCRVKSRTRTVYSLLERE